MLVTTPRLWENIYKPSRARSTRRSMGIFLLQPQNGGLNRVIDMYTSIDEVKGLLQQVVADLEATQARVKVE